MRGSDLRWHVMLQSLRTITTRREQKTLLDTLLVRPGVSTLTFVNAHTMNLVRDDPALARAIASSTHPLRDGSGLYFLLTLLRRPSGLNMNGTDLIPRILARHGGRRVALFGTSEPYLSRAARVIRRQTGIARENLLVADGFQPDAFYIEQVREFRPEIVVLGMGAPRQEQLSTVLAAAMPNRCLIISGGAILDFYAGRFPRAPGWMRAVGIEWMFRLACEPRRLFRRYVIGNPRFIGGAVRYAWLSAVRRLPSMGGLRGPMTEMPFVPADEGPQGVQIPIFRK